MSIGNFHKHNYNILSFIDVNDVLNYFLKIIELNPKLVVIFIKFVMKTKKLMRHIHQLERNQKDKIILLEK